MKIDIDKTKYCKWCGMEFIPNTPSRIYCCDRCQAAAMREKKKAWSDNRYRLLYGTPEERKKAKQPRFKPVNSNTKQNSNLNERARRQKETGVSAGLLEAYKDNPDKLKAVIEYKQKYGYAKPCDVNTPRIFGYKDRM